MSVCKIVTHVHSDILSNGYDGFLHGLAYAAMFEVGADLNIIARACDIDAYDKSEVIDKNQLAVHINRLENDRFMFSVNLIILSDKSVSATATFTVATQAETGNTYTSRHGLGAAQEHYTGQMDHVLQQVQTRLKQWVHSQIFGDEFMNAYRIRHPDFR